MGRKPKAIKNVDKLPTPGNELPNKGRLIVQGLSGNKKQTNVLGSQLENPHPMCSPPKHPNLLVAGVQTSVERITPQEQINQASKHQKKHSKFTQKFSKHHSASVRRSERIKSGVVKASNAKQGIEYIVDVTASDSEKDEPDTQTEQVIPEPQSNTQIDLVLPQPDAQVEQALPDQNAQIEQLLLEPELVDNFSEKSLDEKVDYALRKIEALYKIIEMLKSKVNEKDGLHEASPVAPISYRSMYIDSQKKLEALANENKKLSGQLENALGKIKMLESLSNENRQLTGQLENALGKVEMYEKENHVLSELLGEVKDTANQQLSNLAKTTEAAVNALTKEIDNAYSASAAKRKRIEG